MSSIAIVGRPNVGKSTLFNRLVGKPLALVYDEPGVTRDRQEAHVTKGARQITIIDTAGLSEGDAASLTARMTEQTARAVTNADIALFMLDARQGVTPTDKHYARWLRRFGKPILLLANKAEKTLPPHLYGEMLALGFGEPLAISAEHNIGIKELWQTLLRDMPETTASEDDTNPSSAINLAIIGRPNVGKSTLINNLLGEERMLTGPEAGITRDAICIPWDFQGQAINLYDTAGIRRRNAKGDAVEGLSVADTYHAVQFAHVAVVVIDASARPDKQDWQLAAHVVQEGRALIIAANKWDSVKDKPAVRKELNDLLGERLAQVPHVPLLMLSGQKGVGVTQLMQEVLRTYNRWNTRVPTAKLNRWLEEVTAANPPPSVAGKRLNVKYISQVKARPPTFMLSVSRPSKFPVSYERYLAKSLRDSFDLAGVPLRFTYKASANPYVLKPNR